jgi:hypothetical protein
LKFINQDFDSFEGICVDNIVNVDSTFGNEIPNFENRSHGKPFNYTHNLCEVENSIEIKKINHLDEN